MKYTNLCDEQQFTDFYKQEVNNVFRFILIKSKNKDEAFDIVQEAFVKIWENCNKFDIFKVKSYLFSTATNIFFNIKKHEKVVRNYQNEAPDLYIDSHSPEDVLREEEFKHKLEKAIENLTDAQREVFLLNRVEGKKYKEMAALLNISIKAVEKRMSKALMALRLEIDEFN